MQVVAIDTDGNKFKKQVTTRTPIGTEHDLHKERLIICFGWPVEYYAKDLLKHYPFQSPLCIDISGRNHKGCQVSISAEQMDSIVEKCIIGVGDAIPMPENLDF